MAAVASSWREKPPENTFAVVAALGPKSIGTYGRKTSLEVEETQLVAVACALFCFVEVGVGVGVAWTYCQVLHSFPPTQTTTGYNIHCYSFAVVAAEEEAAEKQKSAEHLDWTRARKLTAVQHPLASAIDKVAAAGA